MFELTARATGAPGIRNHLAVVSTVVCSNHVARAIADSVGAELVTHDTGCLQLGRDRDLTFDTLLGATRNPNVGAALLVGLGCEQQPPEALASYVGVARSDQLTIQSSGGSEAAIATGIRDAIALKDEMSGLRTTRADWKELTVALRVSDEEDSSSGRLSEVFGHVTDGLLDRGARVVLAETWPFIEVADVVAERFEAESDRHAWLEFVGTKRRLAEARGADVRLLSGIASGTAENPLRRLGSAPLRGLLEYGASPKAPGLWIMKAPHEDVFAGPGIVGSGTHVLIHGSTGANLFSPPIVPALKVTASSRSFALMPDLYDVDASESTTRYPQDSASRILDRLEEVIRGRKTLSEEWRGQDFAIPRIGATL